MSVLSKRKKRFIILIAVVCVLAITALSVILQKPKAYDYSHLFAVTNVEQGKPFKGYGGSVAGMEKSTETDVLELYVNPKTAEIAVKDKRSGKIWYSNPANLENDTLANSSEKDRLSSQLSVSFLDSLQREFAFLSYTDSTSKGQFDVESISDGVRVNYTMGDISDGATRVPRYITQERFDDKILSKVDKKQAAYMKKRYIESPVKKGFLEVVGINLTSDIILGKMIDILDVAGYTLEDVAYEDEQAGYEMASKKPFLKISIEYKLQNDQLVVTVPLERVEFEKSMNLLDVKLLTAFGAGSTADEGYIVVPSGSGGIINFNNGKQREDPYLQPIYGMDTIMMPGSQMQSSQSARLPIFGIKSGDDAYLAYIDEGAAIASISADVSGRKNSYNTVSPQFLLRSYDQNHQLTETKVVEKHMYSSNITTKYCFLEQDKADYSGMAGYYRDMLIEAGSLKRLDVTTDQPFYLDLLGAAQKMQVTLGVPNQAVESLTTYEEANMILDELSELNINAVQLRYQGWFNRGVNHDVANKIKLDKQVGSKKELSALDSRLRKQNGALYPDVSFSLVPYNSKGYSFSSETARMIAGYTGNMAPYSPSNLFMTSNSENGVSMINSAHALPDQITDFISAFGKLPVNNISLRDMGDILSSDKNKKRPADRETAMKINKEQLARLAEATDSTMISGGNSYALGYADHLIDVPTYVDRYYIIDQEIPFYQIVVHGYVDYAGTAVNISENYDEQRELLRMVEYGYAPHFVWTYKPTADLQDTSFTRHYSTYYSDWIDTANTFYTVSKQMNEPVRTAEVIKHIIHPNGLREMRYDNGIINYINYSDVELKANGVIVSSNSYTQTKGEGNGV